MARITGLTNKGTKRLRYWLTPFLERLPDSCFKIKPRSFHGYCFGMPKTGAAPVVAGTFLPQFRSAHEPEIRFFSYRVLAYRSGKLSRSDFENYLRKRDRRLQLDMESSYLNSEIVDVLVDVFPDAKFVFTIQDCFSWLQSFVTFQAKLMRPSRFSIRRDRVKLGHLKSYMQLQGESYSEKFDEEEAPLKELGMLPLDVCFSFWQSQNERILRAIPSERLLVLRSDQIDNSRPRLEEFFGIPPDSLSAPYRTPPVDIPCNVLEEIPKEFILSKAQKYCANVMEQYYPEIWQEQFSVSD